MENDCFTLVPIVISSLLEHHFSLTRFELLCLKVLLFANCFWTCPKINYFLLFYFSYCNYHRLKNSYVPNEFHSSTLLACCRNVHVHIWPLTKWCVVYCVKESGDHWGQSIGNWTNNDFYIFHPISAAGSYACDVKCFWGRLKI